MAAGNASLSIILFCGKKCYRKLLRYFEKLWKSTQYNLSDIVSRDKLSIGSLLYMSILRETHLDNEFPVETITKRNVRFVAVKLLQAIAPPLSCAHNNCNCYR